MTKITHVLKLGTIFNPNVTINDYTAKYNECSPSDVIFYSHDKTNECTLNGHAPQVTTVRGRGNTGGSVAVIAMPAASQGGIRPSNL